MKETRKQKIDRQRGYQVDRAMRPIHDAMDRGDLVFSPVRQTPDEKAQSIMSGLEFCPRCASGPRQAEDVIECPDCGYRWSGPPLRGAA